ncbi:MAG: hypothetical protein AAFQ82_09325 [Myxococcota bacterium]
MNRRILGVFLGVAFVAFSAFTFWLAGQTGYFGFLEVMGRELWALQLGLDLVIACVLLLPYVLRDAKRRGIPAWPIVVATATLGTIPLLAYYAWRFLADAEPRLSEGRP